MGAVGRASRMAADAPNAPIPGVPTDRTLTSLLKLLRDEGFERDMFVTGSATLRCGVCGQESLPSQVAVHAVRRVEGASDPADEAAVLALSCPACGARCTAVVRYGPEADPQDGEVLRRLEDGRAG